MNELWITIGFIPINQDVRFTHDEIVCFWNTFVVDVDVNLGFVPAVDFIIMSK